MKATTTLGLCLLIIISVHATNDQPTDIHKTDKNKAACSLLKVFSSEVDSTNQEFLKLYSDNSYEFLVFRKINKRTKVKREKGTYHWNKNKLVLKKQSKQAATEHPFHFCFLDGKGLSKFQRFNRTDKELLYVLNTDSKFWQPTYQDAMFGEINNDKKASKKIIEKKPVYIPVVPLVAEPVVIESTSDIMNTEENNVTENIIYNKKFLSRDSLKKLKAIIVVGPVSDELDKNTIENQKKTAKYLRSLGVQVFEFYPPNDKWEAIVKATQGAHILMYNGHGSNQGINGGVGGLCLTENIYSAQDILDNFKLHKNALVLFNSVCSAAGSSAGDNGDIGKNEAFKRVSDYAYPFLKLKAGGYFANNSEDCLIPFLQSFFIHKNIKTIYIKQATAWDKIEGYKKYPYDPQFEVSVASEEGTNEIRSRFSSTNNGPWVEEKYKDFKEYNVAYVGKPNFTVVDLFK